MVLGKPFLNGFPRLAREGESENGAFRHTFCYHRADATGKHVRFARSWPGDDDEVFLGIMFRCFALLQCQSLEILGSDWDRLPRIGESHPPGRTYHSLQLKFLPRGDRAQ